MNVHKSLPKLDFCLIPDLPRILLESVTLGFGEYGEAIPSPMATLDLNSRLQRHSPSP